MAENFESSDEEMAPAPAAPAESFESDDEAAPTRDVAGASAAEGFESDDGAAPAPAT